MKGPPPGAPKKKAPGTILVAAVLLAVHAGLLLHSAGRNFVTMDEAGHIAAGISHWQSGTYSMYRVNPPLPRMLAALPVLAAGPTTDTIRPVDVPADRLEFSAGRTFAEANAGRYLRLVFLARLAGIGWSLLAGWVIYRWAAALYGWGGGLLALSAWSFGPNVLAHAGLATPDVPAAASGLVATYVFWRYLQAPSWRWACTSGLLLGVALLTKFTLLILYPVWAVLWLAACRARGGKTPSTTVRIGQGLLIVSLSVLTINLGYEFRDTCRPLGEFPFVSRTFAGDLPGGEASGNRFQGGCLGRVPVPVPADFLRGIDVQRRDFDSNTFLSYLAGEWRTSGWWYYYLYALGVKVPLGILALTAWALLLAALHRTGGASWVDDLALWLPALAILALVSSQTGFNHHLRYVLPSFPFAIVATGRLAAFCRPGQWKAGALVVALLLWAAGSSLRMHPHYLSYFNELAGGPTNGHNHLDNSNIDCGQDLLYLKSWLEDHPEARPLRLAYFNWIDPSVVGIKFTLPPLVPQPGYCAVSATFVCGKPFSAPDGQGGRVEVPLGRYSYFRYFRPVARAGYSIFIYRVSAEEANAVRRRLGLPPQGRSE